MTFVFIFISIILTATLIVIAILSSKVNELIDELDSTRNKVVVLESEKYKLGAELLEERSKEKPVPAPIIKVVEPNIFKLKAEVITSHYDIHVGGLDKHSIICELNKQLLDEAGKYIIYKSTDIPSEGFMRYEAELNVVKKEKEDDSI